MGPPISQFLAFLQARQLVTVTVGSPERVGLTAAGRKLAERLTATASFAPIVERCDAMVGNLAAMTGTQLKDFVYDLFPSEVGDAPMRSEIQQ